MCDISSLLLSYFKSEAAFDPRKWHGHRVVYRIQDLHEFHFSAFNSANCVRCLSLPFSLFICLQSTVSSTVWDSCICCKSLSSVEDRQRKSFFFPSVSVQYAHQLIRGNNTDTRFKTAKMWVPETWLSWDAGIRLHAVCHRQWLSALHSGATSIHLPSLFSFPSRVGGLDRADSSSAFLTGGTIGWLIWQSKAIRVAGWGDRKGRASERTRRGQRGVEKRSLEDEGNWSGVI